MFAAWIEARAKQREGYWYDPMSWHQTPHWHWGRWLIGHKWRRVRRWRDGGPYGYEYATDREYARQQLAVQFDPDYRRGNFDADGDRIRSAMTFN